MTDTISVDRSISDAGLRGFLDVEFDGRPGLIEEFPLLVGPSNRHRCLVIREGPEIVAHAAWRPLILRSRAGSIPAAGIGLVTTRGDRRDRGLASLAVDACLREAETAGVWMAILFAPARSIYARLGFVPAGRERITRVHPRREVTPGRAPVRGGPKDAYRLRPLLDRHPVGVERTAEEFESLLGVPDTTLHLLEEGDDPVAYCVAGRGRDLQGVIHEWAGDPEPVARLLNKVIASQDAPRSILSPASLPAPVPGVHHEGPMAQVRIVRPEELGTDDPVEAFGSRDHEARVPIYVWGLDSF